MSVLTPDLACQQAVELVTDYLEGKLSWRQRRRFEKHLRGLPELLCVPAADPHHHRARRTHRAGSVGRDDPQRPHRPVSPLPPPTTLARHSRVATRVCAARSEDDGRTAPGSRARPRAVCIRPGLLSRTNSSRSGCKPTHARTPKCAPSCSAFGRAPKGSNPPAPRHWRVTPPHRRAPADRCPLHRIGHLSVIEVLEPLRTTSRAPAQSRLGVLVGPC